MGDQSEVKGPTPPVGQPTVHPEPREVAPPAVENTAPAKEESTERGIPYPRFKEVIDEKNALMRRLNELESRFNTQSQAQEPEAVSRAVKKLVQKGMDEDAAKELVSTQFELAAQVAEERVAPLRQSQSKKEVDEWVAGFKKDHPDYNELEPQMYEAWRSLSPAAQDLIVADQRGLELLYDHVKVKKLEEDLKQRYEQGIQDGYQNKQAKIGVSGEPNRGSSKGIPSRRDIAQMSLEDYMKIREELLRNQGSIPE